MEKSVIEQNRITMESLPLSPVLIVINDPNHESKINIITISYVSVLSENPPIIGIAVRPRRYSTKLLLNEMQFTLNVPTPEILSELDFCGSYSGAKIDKQKIMKFDLTDPISLNTPMIVNCPINMECQVVEVLSNEHLQSSHIFFIAKVINAVRKKNYSIENSETIVTTNYTYRQVKDRLGTAYQMHKKGGS